MELKYIIEYLKGFIIGLGYIMMGVSFAYCIGTKSFLGFLFYIIFAIPSILIILSIKRD